MPRICAVCPRRLTADQIRRQLKTCSPACGNTYRTRLARQVRRNHGGKRERGWQPLAINEEKRIAQARRAGSWWIGDPETFYARAAVRAVALRVTETSTAHFQTGIADLMRTKDRTYAAEQQAEERARGAA